MTISVRIPCDTGQAQAAPEVAGCSRATGRAVLIAAVLGSSMAFVDGTIVNVALPVLQDDLGATVAALQVSSFRLIPRAPYPGPALQSQNDTVPRPPAGATFEWLK